MIRAQGIGLYRTTDGVTRRREGRARWRGWRAREGRREEGQGGRERRRRRGTSGRVRPGRKNGKRNANGKRRAVGGARGPDTNGNGAAAERGRGRGREGEREARRVGETEKRRDLFERGGTVDGELRVNGVSGRVEQSNGWKKRAIEKRSLGERQREAYMCGRTRDGKKRSRGINGKKSPLKRGKEIDASVEGRQQSREQ